MTERSFVPSALFIIILLAMTFPGQSCAGPRGITRDVQFEYETRSVDGSPSADISRMTLTTRWNWELNRRSTLGVEIPFGTSDLEQDGTGVSADVSGLKDITVDYRLNAREAKSGRPGLFYTASLNLPTGQATLSTEEQAVINAINDAAEGFYNPEYGRGFGLKLGYGLSLLQGANSVLEISAGYSFRGDFDPSEDITRDDADTFYVSLMSRRQVNPRKRVSWGFNALVFGDGEVEDSLLSTKTTVNREPDFLFSYGIHSEVNPGLKRDIAFVYTFRGRKDFVDAGGLNITEDVDLGDRINLEFHMHKKINPRTYFDYGLSYLKTFESEAASGATVFDTERDDARLVIGATRQQNAGFKLKGAIHVGLTDDARDLVTSVGGQWDF